MTSLRTADIVFVRGRGLASHMIRALTRSPGESATEVSHVALAISPSRIVEALGRGVTVREIAYHPSRVRVFRPLNIEQRTRIRIAACALNRVGQPYGWLKLPLHALDGLLGGVRLFRRLAFVDGTPICSYLVADAYQSAGYRFGVETREATPDDLWDFCVSNPDKYRRVAWAG